MSEIVLNFSDYSDFLFEGTHLRSDTLLFRIHEPICVEVHTRKVKVDASTQTVQPLLQIENVLFKLLFPKTKANVS